MRLPKFIKYTATTTFMVALVLVSAKTWSVDKGTKENTVHYNGNEIRLAKQHVYASNAALYLRDLRKMPTYLGLPDSIPDVDPNTGEVFYKAVPKVVVPVAINGKPIYGKELQYSLDEEVYTDPVFKGGQKV